MIAWGLFQDLIGEGGRGGRGRWVARHGLMVEGREAEEDGKKAARATRHEQRHTYSQGHKA